MTDLDAEFKVGTNEAYQVKILSELIDKNIEEGNLVFDEEGITFREVDEKELVMIDVVLRAADLQYEPPPEPIHIGFTCQHLYKVLRRIKKKDKLSIHRVKGSDEILVNILNTDKDRDKDGSIRIKEVKKTQWDMPAFPKNPIAQIPAAEFQRMCKEMGGSKQVTLEVQKTGVRFVGGATQLSSIGDKYGLWVKDGEILYKKTFDSKQLAHLAKCSGLATNNYLKLFCAGADQPILISSPIGSIGTFKACISSES